MQAKDVMTTNVVTVGLDTEVREIAKRLHERGISAVPVVSVEGEIVGIVSEGDLMRRPESGTERHRSWWLALMASPDEQAREYIKTHGLRASDVMTPDVVTVAEDALLEEVATKLERHRIKRVPVTRDGTLVGIVSRANLLHGLVALQSESAPSPDDRQIRDAVMASLEEVGVTPVFVDVVVSGGVAYLWGAAQNQVEKHAIRVAAESSAGVTAVEDHLGIFPQSVRSTIWAE